MAIQPIRMPGPTNVPGARVAPPRPPRVVVSQGGRAAPVRQQAPARVAPKAPAVTPDQAATNSAMAAFQTALAHLKASTPPVDAAAIHAPYTASEAVTGQLGTGYQQAQQNAGAAASQQYTQGLNDAQKAAASFGISAGAGANPTQLQNTGTAPLASQTLANSASAAAGVQQWQQLLERAAANKISDATVARQNSLTSGEQGLSATIPQAIMNEKTLANQQSATRGNNAYLWANMTAKQQADARKYGLDVARLDASTAAAGSRTSIDQKRLAETQRHDKATEKGARIRAQKASATGAKGIPQVLAALKIAGGTGATTSKAAKGFDVQIQPWGTKADGTQGALGPATTKHLPRLDVTLPGYKVLTNTATTHYETVPSSGSKAGGMTLSQWNRAVGVYQTYNGVSRSEAVKAVQQITPRPPK